MGNKAAKEKNARNTVASTNVRKTDTSTNVEKSLIIAIEHVNNGTHDMAMNHIVINHNGGIAGNLEFKNTDIESNTSVEYYLTPNRSRASITKI
ncbi:hypothetical protein BGZ72_002196, partial [Mortierella alpina]